ncbi:hypothetical protein TWF594_003182 [Orbilia oligospora]|nr:hypothetical protein TWF594_003182 [Orbilia oligospora]
MSRSTIETETQILTNFLLSNSTFPDMVDLKTFRSLFPKNLQDHPHVKHLYNHLTLKHAATLETVRKNIDFEAKMSHQLLKRERRETANQNRDEDAEMLNQTDINNMEMEILDEDCERLTQEIKDIVGDLSTLKFGSFTGANEGLVDSVIEDLARLQDTCDQAVKPAD